MRNKNKAIIIFLLLLVGLIVYINIKLQVSGSDIEKINDITSDNIVSLTRWDYQTNHRLEYILNKEQKEKLKSLIVESNYRKILSSKISSIDNVRYEIRVKKSENELGLMFDSMGGDYLLIPFQFDGKFLEIKNPNWKEEIEEIILFSK